MCRVEVEESWRCTRSKLFCISPTTCGLLVAQRQTRRKSEEQEKSPGHDEIQLK
jgi:hypothetical protein